jgi:hypothetical protein
MERADMATPGSPAPVADLISRGRRRQRTFVALALAPVLGVLATGGYLMLPDFGGHGNAIDPGTDSPGIEADVDNLASVDEWCPETPSSNLILDVPGPGQNTPEEAVEKLESSAARLVRIDDSGKFARVAVVDGEGRVTRVYKLYERSDGWWPQGYTKCGISTGPE